MNNYTIDQFVGNCSEFPKDESDLSLLGMLRDTKMLPVNTIGGTRCMIKIEIDKTPEHVYDTDIHYRQRNSESLTSSQ
jgi:hypothetical protein